MFRGTHAYPCDRYRNMTWELALLPPVARFFAGILLVLIIAGGSALFIYWISTMYGKEE